MSINVVMSMEKVIRLWSLGEKGAANGNERVDRERDMRGGQKRKITEMGPRGEVASVSVREEDKD